MLRYIFLFAVVVLGVKSAKAPFVKPCKVTDIKCIMASAQAALPIVAPGIPELGIKSLDPLHLKLIKGDGAGLQLTFKDTILTGMKGCIVDDVKIDLVKRKQGITIRCNVTLNGDYKLGGQLLVLPVQGQGRYTIHIDDIIIKTHTELTTVTGADNEQHWHINKWRHTYSVRTGTVFKFQNLFNGNQLLAGPVESFLNTSWREVMKEVAPPIVYAIVNAVVEGVEALYTAVPSSELIIYA